MITQELSPQFLKLLTKHKQTKKLPQHLIQQKYLSQAQIKHQQQSFDFGFSQNDWNSMVKQQLPSNNKQEEDKQNVYLKKQSDQFSSFQNQFQQTKQDNLIKKMKLQKLYNHAKSKKKGKNKGKQLSQLEQISQFNQISNKFSFISVQKNQKVSYNQNQNNQQDFFASSQFQQGEQEFQFPSKNNKIAEQLYLSEASQKQFEDQSLNSRERQYINFQTQNLLNKSDQQQAIQPSQFSIKTIPANLNRTKLFVHLLSTVIISVIYGFFNAIILLIIHDFSQFVFIMADYSFKIKLLLNNKQSPCVKSNNKSQSTLNNYGVCDQIKNQVQQQKLNSHVSYLHNLKFLLKFHTSFKLSLYLSSMSLVGFIICSISQIDTFFTTSYFSLDNWGSIIVLLAILIAQILINTKLVIKIQQIIFYERNALKDTKQIQEKLQNSQNRPKLQQDSWD